MAPTPKPIDEILPRPQELRRKLADLLREVKIVRGMLRIIDKADRERGSSYQYPSPISKQ